MSDYIIINKRDNVGVALRNLFKGDAVSNITLLTDVPEKHKFALGDIKKGENVIKYGYSIGVASQDIKKGEYIHSHNLKTGLTEKESYEFTGDNDCTFEKSDITFNGYLRENGRVGIRNRLLIVPTVGCANSAALKIGERVGSELGAQEVQVLTHPYGCSQLGDDAKNTALCISQLCKNPNVGGCLIISLGCENNNLQYMESFLKGIPESRIQTLNMQECEDEVAEGFSKCKKLLQTMKNDVRTPQSVSKLTIGFKCGGSDGYSGITANVLCGKICDAIVNAGGRTILTEVPEMFGAEKLLLARSRNKEVFEKGVKLIESFKDYFVSHNQVVYENPSPGNKEGGITTLEEKSLGCVTKGGTAVVTDVLDMYESCKTDGLSLLWGPGNDIVSTTNMAAAGVNMILFTTGRGTPLGAPVPTVKLSTNTELYSKKKNWIDFNCGTLLAGEGLENSAKNLLNYIIEIANGKKTLNEKHGIEEIAIFKDGVTL